VLLDYYAAYSGNYLPTFQYNLSVGCKKYMPLTSRGLYTAELDI